MRRIGSDADIREGLEALTGACPHLARVHALTGNPPLRKRPKGFEGLSRVVVGQQLSIASADAIWGRVRASVEPFEAATLLKIPDKDLRKAGLSDVAQAHVHSDPKKGDFYVAHLSKPGRSAEGVIPDPVPATIPAFPCPDFKRRGKASKGKPGERYTTKPFVISWR